MLPPAPFNRHSLLSLLCRSLLAVLFSLVALTVCSLQLLVVVVRCCLLAMLSFGRAPVPYGALPLSGKAHMEEEKEQASEETGRQHRSRYYAHVLPAALPGLPRRSSQPLTASAALPIAAAAAPSVSRFARANVSAALASHSLPSALRRSQPIDIPAAPRPAARAAWYRNAWQAAADDTDGSSGSGESDMADERWYVDGSRRLSDSFVDDSQLQWSGRCLEDSQLEADTLAARSKRTAWSKRATDSDSDVEDSDDEVETGSVVPFPLLAPSYHVDFELN